MIVSSLFVPWIQQDEAACRLSLMPKDSKAKSIPTAFCSYQESTNESGKSFTPQLNASAIAIATLTAEYESLHCPQSSILGKPATVPKSSLSKRSVWHKQPFL